MFYGDMVAVYTFTWIVVENKTIICARIIPNALQC